MRLNLMVAFTKTQTVLTGLGEINSFVGLPDCNAFYSWVLSTLEEVMHHGFTAPNPPLTSITTGQMGNLGEAITVIVGKEDRFLQTGYVSALGGALTPFNPGTTSGVDITIVYLDPNGVVSNDRLFIQEVKTTGAAALGYSSALIEDYKKLLDTTRPALSLMSRVSSMKAKLKWEHGWGNDLLIRLENLAQPQANQCDRIRLLPTLIHDRGSDPISALTNVMTQINNQGWPPGCIEAWSISMYQLNQALLNMANRIHFTA